MTLPAHLKYIALSILFVVASINLTRTTLSIIQSSKRLDEVKEDVLTLETKQKELEEQLAYKQTEEFIEEKARNELNMIKPGEDVYIAPENLVKENNESTTLGSSTKRATSKTESNAEKWVALFF